MCPFPLHTEPDQHGRGVGFGGSSCIRNSSPKEKHPLQTPHCLARASLQRRQLHREGIEACRELLQEGNDYLRGKTARGREANPTPSRTMELDERWNGIFWPGHSQAQVSLPRLPFPAPVDTVACYPHCVASCSDAGFVHAPTSHVAMQSPSKKKATMGEQPVEDGAHALAALHCFSEQDCTMRAHPCSPGQGPVLGTGHAAVPLQVVLAHRHRRWQRSPGGICPKANLLCPCYKSAHLWEASCMHNLMR